MFRGLYTAGTAMLTQNKRMDVVANNLANAQTVGFKKDSLISRSFNDILLSEIYDDDAQVFPVIGPTNTGIHVDRTITSFEAGSLEDTGTPSDFALIGDGFFVIETANGMRFTRAGNFAFDANGRMLTTEGNIVMGTQGEIRVNPKDFNVDSSGNIYSEGVLVNRFSIVEFNNTDNLKKEGSSLYIASNPEDVRPSTTLVKQGALETANVDLTKEYINMIELSRNQESNQRVIRMLDEVLGKAVNEIGAVN